jgi:hypothetical protein
VSRTPPSQPLVLRDESKASDDRYNLRSRSRAAPPPDPCEEAKVVHAAYSPRRYVPPPRSGHGTPKPACMVPPPSNDDVLKATFEFKAAATAFISGFTQDGYSTEVLEFCANNYMDLDDAAQLFALQHMQAGVDLDELKKLMRKPRKKKKKKKKKKK